MPTLCLFCDNKAGSREHLWPAWIHERKKFGPIRHQIGNRIQKILPNPPADHQDRMPDLNYGWMSQLESDKYSGHRSMFADLPVPLDEDQQKLISAWAVKTSIVVDSVQGREPEKTFYRRDECVDMRLTKAIPARTRIWIGRSALQSLRAIGTHIGMFTPGDPGKNAGHGS